MKRYTIQLAFLCLCIAGLFNACIHTTKMETGSDYQLYIEGEDSVSIYDGERRVGAIPINWENPSELDSIIMKDNL